MGWGNRPWDFGQLGGVAVVGAFVVTGRGVVAGTSETEKPAHRIQGHSGQAYSFTEEDVLNLVSLVCSISQGCGVGVEAGVRVLRSRLFWPESQSELVSAKFGRLLLQSGVAAISC